MANGEQHPNVTDAPFLMAEVAMRREEIAGWIAAEGHIHTEEPFELSSAGFNYDFIDAKVAISNGERLKIVGSTIANVALLANVEFDAVGGLTMGADPIVHATAMVAEKNWFTVRKKPKGRGTNQLIEGTVLGPGTRAIIVDDVTSTGNSMFRAVDAVRATGADVTMAIALVDRGPLTARKMDDESILYRAVVTYEDLGIDPIGLNNLDA